MPANQDRLLAADVDEPETEVSIAREGLASAQSILDAALASQGEGSVLVEVVREVRDRCLATVDEREAAQTPQVTP